MGEGQQASDATVVAALRRGDEGAFAELIRRHHRMMVRVARLYVRDEAIAEEVAQEAWLGVLEGIGRFEGRSSLRTWIFRILTNRAKTRGERERRSVPFTALTAEDAAPAVEPERFHPPGEPNAQMWTAPPRDWPERELIAEETSAVIRQAIEALPEQQRQVIRLRDVEGWAAEEVVAALEISDGNQRVLLHRARSQVRAAVETYMEARLETEGAAS